MSDKEPTVISADGLTKQYGDTTAVDRVTLQVTEQEAFGFIGPNGAGKSTMINMLLGLVHPTAGSATVFGYDVTEKPNEISKRIGVLPEGITLAGEFTAREHLKDTILNKQADDDPQELLSRVGLPDAIDRRVSEFSTGMRQRLGLAIALVGDPDLLLLDEPSAGLDPNGIQLMQSIVTQEVESGTTVFFSSHILPQVQAVCDRAAIINQGQLVTVDGIESLREEFGKNERIEFELTTPIENPPELSAVSSVVNTAADGQYLTVTVSESAAKSTVVGEIESQFDIADFHLNEPSLDSVFSRATTSPSEQSEEVRP